jgi:hypothetical protein
MQTWRRNLVLADLIDEIDSNRPAPVIWLKGSQFLQEQTYPSGVRRLSDIDVLVKKEDLPEWSLFFENLGFKPHRSVDWITSADYDRTVSSTWFTGSVQGQTTTIDVHWNLIDFPARRLVDLWNMSMEPVWNHSSDRKLAPEQRLLYIADHAFTHSFRRWKWFIDMKAVVDGNEFDEDFFRREVERFGMSKILRVTVETFKSITDLNLLPAKLRDCFQDSGSLSSTERRFVRRSSRAKSEVGDYLKVCYEQLHRPSDKIRFLRKIIWPGPEAIPDLAEKPSMLEMLRIYATRTLKVLKEGTEIFSRV